MRIKYLLLLLLIELMLVTGSMSQTTLPSYIPKNGLVAWWPFDGNANDVSGNANHGVLKGGVSLTNDRLNLSNKAYSFKGTTDSYIDVPFSSSLNVKNSLTISAWVFMDGGYYNPRIISIYNGRCESFFIAAEGTSNTSRNFNSLFVNSDCQTGAGFCCNVPGITVPSLTWQHIVFTVDTSGVARFYLNGELKNTKAGTKVSSPAYVSSLNIGRNVTPAYDAWGGKLDDIGIWNRSLSANEILQVFNAKCVTSQFNPFSDTTSFCGISGMLNSGVGYKTYLWNNGEKNSAINVTKSDWYKVEVSDSTDCISTDSTYVTILNSSIIESDTTICKGTPIQLRVQSHNTSQTACSIAELPISLRNGLVAYYPFCGNANDVSGVGGNGVVNGPVLTTDRFNKPNSAYSFNSNYIIVPSSDAFNSNNFTVSMWVKSVFSGTQVAISRRVYSSSQNEHFAVGLSVGKTNGVHFAVKYNNPNCYAGSGWQINEKSQNVLDGKFHHIVSVVDGGMTKVYVDGVLLQTLSTPYSKSASCWGGDIQIGRNWSGDPAFFKGDIDDVMVYNRALSVSEISQLYQQSSSVSWSTGEASNTITVAPNISTTYYAQINYGSTTCKDSVTVNVDDVSLYNPFPATTNLSGDSLILDAGSGFSKYVWSNGETSRKIIVWSPGLYKVSVTSIGGCNATDSVTVQTSDTVGLHVKSVNAICNKSVDIPVRVTRFRKMLTMQGSLNWNPGDLRFDSVIAYGPAILSMNASNFGTTNVSTGKLTFSWNDVRDIGVTLDDSTSLFTLRFTALGSVNKSVAVSLSNDPISLEFIDSSLVKHNVKTTNGSVSIACEFTINGQVLTPLGGGVRNTSILLSGPSGNSTVTTNTNGQYSFKVLPGTYILTPSRNLEQDKRNGISTLDIALIQSHILQRRLLDVAYKIIAADVDNTSSITTADILHVRRLILGTDTTFPGNRLWAMVDGGQTFANPLVPFPFNSTKTFTNQSTDVSHTFRGIKIGDVNYDRNPLLDQAPSGDTLRLFGEWIDTEDGYVTLKVKSRAVSGLLGWQSTLRWDAKQLPLQSTMGLINNLGIGERWKDEGYLTLSWNDPRAEGLSFTEGSTWMELRFRKTSALQRAGIGMTEEKLGTEAFNGNYQSMGVKMEPVELRGNAWNGMMRVYPNPATQYMNVEWKMARAGAATVRLLDTQGRVVHVQRGEYGAGVQRATIRRGSGWSVAGTWMVQVEVDGEVWNVPVVLGGEEPRP